MTIRGYGAGAGVTAAGVFGDILRTVSGIWKHKEVYCGNSIRKGFRA